MGSRGPSLYPVVASSVLVLAGGMMKNCAVILSVFFTLCLGSIQDRSTADMLRSLISELSKKSDTCMCPPAFREEGSPPEGGPPEGGPEFTCADGETTIPAHWVNDKEDDCGDCSDETACTECSTWADGYDPTCWDYSSEERALAKKEDTCECPDFDADDFNSAYYDMENDWAYIGPKFTCANGKEIPANYENDAWDDCGDCSDEPACSACVSSGNEFEPWIDDCWFEGMDSYYHDASDLEAAHNDEHGEVEHGATPEQAAAETPGTSKRQEPQQGGHGKRQEPQQGGHGKRHVLRKLA